MTKIIAMMPVRNEDWILDRTLQTLKQFCDLVIVADQHSTDGTRDILKSHYPKIIYFDNDYETHSTKIRWKLLNVAREYGSNNFLLYTDADEILSSNILDEKYLDQLIKLKPGTAVKIELVNLWRQARKWRNDSSIWTGRWIRVGFKDDGKTRYLPLKETLDHNERIPPFKTEIKFDDLKLLHFQFVTFDRMLCKQRRYRALEAMEIDPEFFDEINMRYCITSDERKLGLSDTKSEWLSEWETMGFDLTNFEEHPIYWYDVEVLRYFKKKGLNYFAPIDIWDVDWEKKRKLAKDIGYDDIIDQSISDPRSLEQKLYHAYLHCFFRVPPWRDLSELKRIPVRWLRATAKACGIR